MFLRGDLPALYLSLGCLQDGPRAIAADGGMADFCLPFYPLNYLSEGTYTIEYLEI